MPVSYFHFDFRLVFHFLEFYFFIPPDLSAFFFPCLPLVLFSCGFLHFSCLVSCLFLLFFLTFFLSFVFRLTPYLPTPPLPAGSRELKDPPKWVLRSFALTPVALAGPLLGVAPRSLTGKGAQPYASHTTGEAGGGWKTRGFSLQLLAEGRG